MGAGKQEAGAGVNAVLSSFMKQVHSQPGATAVIYNNVEYSYALVNNAANLLARVLLDQG